MMKLGFLYAGQGSQHPGMGADLYETFPAFRAVIDSAQVDFDLKEVSFRDAAGVLNQTRYTQPCMVAFAAGMTAVLAERGIVPAAAAGLSLGEYSALHAAGVFDAATAVKLVAFRGKAMEEAAAGRPSAMMAPAGDALAERFRTVDFHQPAIPVVFNCLGGVKPEDAAIPELLVRQVQSSVFMEDSIRAMAGLGIDAFVEIGPGKALSGFVKKTVPEVPIYAVETAADVEALVNAVKENDR